MNEAAISSFCERQRVCRLVTLRPSSLPVAKFQIGYLDSILLVDFASEAEVEVEAVVKIEVKYI